jgi:hypothetical protein
MQSARSVITLSLLHVQTVKNCVPQTNLKEYFSFPTHCLLRRSCPPIVTSCYHHSMHCRSTRNDAGSKPLCCDLLTNLQLWDSNFIFSLGLPCSLDQMHKSLYIYHFITAMGFQLVLYIMNCAFCSSLSSVKFYILTPLHCLKSSYVSGS